MSKGAKKPSAPRRTKRTFSGEYKEEAVRLMRERRAAGVSVAHVARELDIGPALLWTWEQQLGKSPGERTGALPGETLEEEVRRLRRENAILREERAFAKKAAAFFAKESH